MRAGATINEEVKGHAFPGKAKPDYSRARLDKTCLRAGAQVPLRAVEHAHLHGAHTHASDGRLSDPSKPLQRNQGTVQVDGALQGGIDRRPRALVARLLTR